MYKVDAGEISGSGVIPALSRSGAHFSYCSAELGTLSMDNGHGQTASTSLHFGQPKQSMGPALNSSAPNPAEMPQILSTHLNSPHSCK